MPTKYKPWIHSINATFPSILYPFIKDFDKLDPSLAASESVPNEHSQGDLDGSPVVSKSRGRQTVPVLYAFKLQTVPRESALQKFVWCLCSQWCLKLTKLCCFNR